MNNSQIETAQNVQLSQNIANLGDRSLAFLLDTLVIVAYELLMIFLVNSMALSGFSNWIFVLVFGLPPFLYHLLMEAFNNGQSIGKAALRIRVVKLDGSRPTFSSYLLRWLLRIIDFTLTSGGVAIITFLLNGKGQRLGDIAAKTTVISERQTMTLEDTLGIDVPDQYQPVYPQVTIFSDQDLEKIKSLLRKAQNEKDYQIINSLAQKTASVMEVELQEKPIPFLERVITDYNYYTQQA